MLIKSIQSVSCQISLNLFHARLDQKFSSCDSIHVQGLVTFPTHILSMLLCRLAIVPSQEHWEKFKIPFMSGHWATAKQLWVRWQSRGDKVYLPWHPRVSTNVPSIQTAGPPFQAGSLFRRCLPRSDVRSRPAVPSHGTLMAISKHSLAGGCEESTGKIATTPCGRNAPNFRGTKVVAPSMALRGRCGKVSKRAIPTTTKTATSWAFQSASRHGSQDFTFGTGPGCRARGQRWFVFCLASTLRQHDVCRWSGPHQFWWCCQ